MSTAEDTIKAINGIDASRRVGWAKAFDNADKLDGALRDLNVMRGDRDAYCRGVSFLYGAFAAASQAPTTLQGRAHIMRQLVQNYGGADFLFDDDAVADGKDAVDRMVAADDVYAEEYRLERAAREASKRAASRQHSRDWRDAKYRGLLRLAGKHGFTSLSQMYAVLASWQKATNAKPLFWKDVKRTDADLAIADGGPQP